MSSQENLSNTPDYQNDLNLVFGVGSYKLVDQITHDNPELSSEDALFYAWSLISEATAYMNPTSQEVLTESAIVIHEGYEALRRTN